MDLHVRVLGALLFSVARVVVILLCQWRSTVCFLLACFFVVYLAVLGHGEFLLLV